MVNGGPSSFSKDSISHRQGDPLSRFLFIIVMEDLNKMILRAYELGIFTGLKVKDGKHAKEITDICFADDTLLSCDPSERILLNIRCILLSFQVVLDFNINLEKSELVRLENWNDANRLASIIKCKIINLSIKYLRVPLGDQIQGSPDVGSGGSSI